MHSLKLSANKLFKRDSQRVAFLLCVEFLVIKVVCGGIGIALLTP
ncbi:DUF3265 domain-containing protein [Vibrio parahaemolyticus]|nr:DUF3265 domain-containing protein [Vibrio parahaemolyticus]EGQ9303561.1 DUF3265 domain-containing protein [Vibrio vulnificus]EGX6965304.1 DUF3265 domain-containing protein [Vibrio alginolyticus]EJG0940765.1 DUF3265 domain-containing protein [Vibrio parahaemolyticus O1]MBE8569534.1 DUF3265 domain-containing protein [Vibrio sp. OPT46]MBE8583309.1 DUF3265 domain-containing protein [Vibrio sp. OPT41]